METFGNSLNGMRHQQGGGAIGTGPNNATPIQTALGGAHAALGVVVGNGNSVQDGHAAVTVTVGGPSVMQQLQHRSQFSNSSGPFTPGSNSGSGSASGSEINLNASAIVATASDCCGGNVMSFEETKQLLAKHLQETSRARSCCSGGGPTGSGATIAVSGTAGNGTNNLQVSTTNYHHHHHEEPVNFDGIDLGVDDQTPVPLGDILDKLQEESDSLSGVARGSGSDPQAEHCNKNGSCTGDDLNDFIRLHSVTGDGSDHPTISATVNVATLDLSDPDSIHQHLSQLNDTVLRVTTDRLNANASSTENDLFDDSDDPMASVASTVASIAASTVSTKVTGVSDPTNISKQPGQSQLEQSVPISISISNPALTAPQSITSNPVGGTGVGIGGNGSDSSNSLTPEPEGGIATPAAGSTVTDIKNTLGTEKTLTISTTSSSSEKPTSTSASGVTTTSAGSTPPSMTPPPPTGSRKSGSSSGSKASPQSCSVCSKVFSNASALGIIHILRNHF
jgi:hypothetical protein